MDYDAIPDDAPVLGADGEVILALWRGPISRQSLERILDGAFRSALEQQGVQVLTRYPALLEEYLRRSRLRRRPIPEADAAQRRAERALRLSQKRAKARERRG